MSVLHEESNRVSAVLIMLQELSKTHNLMSDYIIYSFYCINYKTILIWSLYTPIIDRSFNNLKYIVKHPNGSLSLKKKPLLLCASTNGHCFIKC